MKELMTQIYHKVRVGLVWEKYDQVNILYIQR